MKSSTSTSTTYCLPSKRRFWQGDRPEWKAGNTLEIELEYLAATPLCPINKKIYSMIELKESFSCCRGKSIPSTLMLKEFPPFVVTSSQRNFNVADASSN